MVRRNREKRIGFPKKKTIDEYNKGHAVQSGGGVPVERDGALVRTELAAWDGAAERIDIRPTPDSPHTQSWNQWLERVLNEARTQVSRRLEARAPQKLWVEIRLTYRGTSNDDLKEVFIISEPITVTHVDLMQRLFQELEDQINARNAKFTQRTDLTIHELTGGAILVTDYQPLRAGKQYKKLPPYLEDKKAIVNVQNTDDRCFGYALLAGIMYNQVREHRYRVLHYINHFEEHHLDDIPYPVEPKDIPALELRLGYAINVYGYRDDDGRSRHTIYTSRYWDTLEQQGVEVPRVKEQTTYDLLYFKDHYAYIHNFNRFMGDYNQHEHTRYFCKRCITSFREEAQLDLHRQFCRHSEFCTTVFKMPDSQRNKLYFNSYRAQVRQPFVIFADVESVLLPVNIQTKKTVAYQQHKAVAVGLHLMSSLPELNIPYEVIVQEGEEDVIEKFLRRLLELEPILLAALFDNRRLVMTEVDQQKFDAADVCYMCQQPFGQSQNESKVRDHCHITGLFRGAAHSLCNLQARNDYSIPVFFLFFVFLDKIFSIIYFHHKISYSIK